MQPHRLYNPWNSLEFSGILQARILEWVAFPFFRGFSQPRDWTQVSYFAGGIFTSWAKREAQEHWSGYPIPSPEDLPDPGIEPGSSCPAGGFFTNWAMREAQMVKNLPEMQETWVWSLGWEDPLENGMATHSSIQAWRIPWTEDPGRLQSMGSQRAGHDWVTNTYLLK